MTAALITVGNEILLGKTLNTNMAFLGAELAQCGIPLTYAIIVKDEAEDIQAALHATWGKYDVVISTGGLGPTDDDITKATIAGFFGKQLHFDDQVWQHVQQLFAVRGIAIPQSNRCQAMVPDDFIPLKNERGTAPGLYYKDGDKLFFALQGVPLEMKHIFSTHITGILQSCYKDAKPVFQRTVHTHGISESGLSELLSLDMCLEGLPLASRQHLSLAWLPQTGRVDLRFYGDSPALIDTAIETALKVISPYVWGFDDDDPAQTLLGLLLKNGNTLSVAESCTGGWLQKLITDVDGCSQSYMGGIVSYSNDLKQSALKVSDVTLNSQGAVSRTCASEMVMGIKLLTNSSHAISVTGIAGPTGGSVEKPVGTVYFGFVAEAKHWTIKQIFTGDRDSIRLKAAEFAILELCKEFQGRNS